MGFWRLDALTTSGWILSICLLWDVACFALDALAEKRETNVWSSAICAFFLALSESRRSRACMRCCHVLIVVAWEQTKCAVIKVSHVCTQTEFRKWRSCEMMIIVQLRWLSVSSNHLMVSMSRLFVGSSEAWYAGLQTVLETIEHEVSSGATSLIRPKCSDSSIPTARRSSPALLLPCNRPFHELNFKVSYLHAVFFAVSGKSKCGRSCLIAQSSLTHDNSVDYREFFVSKLVLVWV